MPRLTSSAPASQLNYSWVTEIVWDDRCDRRIASSSALQT